MINLPSRSSLLNLFLNLKFRLKPRLELRWVISFVLWLILVCYLGFGVYFGVLTYRKHSEANFVQTASKFYPFPAAVINGGFVWVKDYYQQLAYIKQFSEKTKQPIPDEKTLRTQIIEQLIENKLLEMEGAKNGIRVKSKDVNDAYQKIVDQSGGTSEVKKVLNELYGMTEGDFKVLVRQQVLKEKIQNDLITQVQVAHILIKDENRAKEIAERAKKGEDFAALAKQYSEDAKSKDLGGELGFLAKGQLVVEDKTIPEFDQAAFEAKKGDIVGPVKTAIGFEIIKIEDKKGKISENFDNWLNGLKKDATIWRLIK